VSAVSGVVMAIGSLGNNVFNKDQSAKKSDKFNRLIISISLTFICGIAFSFIVAINVFNLAVFIFAISELVRVQLSTIYLAQKDEEQGTIIEVYPLIIGTLLAIIFTLLIRSVWARIYFYSFSSLIVSLWLGRKFIEAHISKFKIANYRWKKQDIYPFLITILISVLFLFEKLAVGKHGDIMLGIYGVNLSILFSSMFYSKWIENSYISRECNSDRTLFFHVFSFISLVLVFSQLLPRLLPLLGLEEYISTNQNMLVMAFVPINILLIGLKLNLLYVRGDLYRITCIAIAVSLSVFLILDEVLDLYWSLGILILYFLVDSVLFLLVFTKKTEHRLFFSSLFVVNLLIFLFIL